MSGGQDQGSSFAQDADTATQTVDDRFLQIDSSKLEEVFRWKQLYYDGVSLGSDDTGFKFPTDMADEVVATANDGNFIPYNNVPMGIEHYQNRLFVTVPRRRMGIPSTLNYVNLQGGHNKSPRLRPFPDLATNTLQPNLQADSSRIVSVYRTRIDECERMWFVDTGLLELPGSNSTQIQPPSIWIWNLQSNQQIRRFEFPADIVQRGSGVASITVDVDRQNCDAAFAYVPDLVNNRLYVYSFRDNRMWSFTVRLTVN